MEGKKKLKIEKKENIILVKKTNNKILLKEALLWIFQIIILLIFSFIFVGFERALFYFPFFIKLGILALVINKLTFTTDENLEIAKDKIILKLGVFGIVFKKYELPNNNNIKIVYDDSLKTSIYTIFTPRTTGWSKKLRRMKFSYENKEYSYGFALTFKEFEEIKNLILEQREKNKGI